MRLSHRADGFLPRSSRDGGLPVLVAVLLLSAAGQSVFAVEEPLEGDWVRFALTGRAYAVAEWGASSVLEADNFWEVSKYDPGKAFDGDPASAWVEGAAGPGIGETIVAAFVEYPEALGFINGFARSQSLFERNHRVKRLELQVYLGVHADGFATESVTYYDALPLGQAQTLNLADSRQAQRVPLPLDPATATEAMTAFRNSEAVRDLAFPQAGMMGIKPDMGVPLRFRYILRLEIAEVYRGTTWEDTCIAEIWPDWGAIARVETADNMRRLVLHTPDGRRIPGYADFESVLTVLAVSDDAEWAIVIKEPAYPGPGRMSGEYAVIHTPTGRDMTAVLFSAVAEGEPPDATPHNTTPFDTTPFNIIPFDIVREGGRLFVVYDDLAAGETATVPVPPLYEH